MQTYVHCEKEGDRGEREERGTLTRDKASIFILHKFWRKKDTTLLTLLLPLTLNKSMTQVCTPEGKSGGFCYFSSPEPF